MTYATPQDLIDRFGQDELVELTDRSRLGAIDAAVIARALADADAEIDGYLSGVCPLPLVSVPPRLVKIAADIARYQLYDRAVTDAIKARYDDAIKYLRLLAGGQVSLGLDAANQPVAEVGGVQFTASARVFNAATLSDY